MKEVMWYKIVDGDRLSAKVMALAQQIAGLGNNVKVSVYDKWMTVRGVGLYDEEKNMVLEENGFSVIDL